jgi:formate dehydrogenase major subunit
MLVGTASGTSVTYVQGNPDHPINQGSLCSKGQATAQVRTVDGADNCKRITQPMYRGPGDTDWTPIGWVQAINQIAQRIKDTRDATTVLEEEIDGDWTPVNRCEGIANLGGACHDNEECYLLVKLLRALGLVYIEHQARI